MELFKRWNVLEHEINTSNIIYLSLFCSLIDFEKDGYISIFFSVLQYKTIKTVLFQNFLF